MAVLLALLIFALVATLGFLALVVITLLLLLLLLLLRVFLIVLVLCFGVHGSFLVGRNVSARSPWTSLTSLSPLFLLLVWLGFRTKLTLLGCGMLNE